MSTCINASTGAPCNGATNCIDQVTAQPCGSNYGNNSGTQVPYADPNYWSGWNNTLGSLGTALGSWSNLFSGNVQPTYINTPQQRTTNTLLYVGLGLMFIVLMVILYITLKKK